MIQTEIAEENALLSGLESGRYHLIVLPHEWREEGYFSRVCGRESLMFALPGKHKYARRKSLSFAEMNGENMLLMDNIGFWSFVSTEEMPDSRFLTQSDQFSFQELVRASSLPSFTTDLAVKYLEPDAGRVHVPVSDPRATVIYYLVCRADARREFQTLFHSL